MAVRSTEQGPVWDHLQECVPRSAVGTARMAGSQVLVVASPHALGEDGVWNEHATGRPVDIGERVWIGARAVVLPGAVIEDDVVVAAGAVVSGRLTSHGLSAGVPAKRIRELAVPA